MTLNLHSIQSNFDSNFYKAKLEYMRILNIFLFLFFTGIQAQTTQFNASVKNVEQIGEQIVISYDLDGPSNNFYTVNLQVSEDGGETYGPFLKEVEGDIGNVKPGKNKKVTWNVLKEKRNLVGDNIRFKIVVEKSEKQKVFTALTGILTGAGIGLLGTGIILENQAFSDYQLYEEIINPNDPIYEVKSREDWYQAANRKHHLAYVSGIVGSVFLINAGVTIIHKIAKNRKLEKKNSAFYVKPGVNWHVNRQNKVNPQFSLSLHF